MHDGLVAEIDAFIQGYKTLGTYMPGWNRRDYGNEWQFRVPIEDAHGAQRGELCFSVDLPLKYPSIVAIYEGRLIYRVDITPQNEIEPNPHGAARLHLPSQVTGPHAHTWENNREWCRRNGFLELPFRSQLPVEVDNLTAALQILAADLNIMIEPGQWNVKLPPASLV